MTPGVTADSIVNLCGAIGVSVAMVALHRRDPRSPLTRRLLFLLGVVAVLFFTRGVAWWTESEWLDWLSLIPAALVPLGALIVTEGIWRRHAPRPVKIVAVLGAILLGLGAVFRPEQFATAYSIALSLFLVAGFLVCAWLLAMRETRLYRSLLPAEAFELRVPNTGVLDVRRDRRTHPPHLQARRRCRPWRSSD